MYARHLGDQPADGFLRILCSLYFLYAYKFWPNFIKPRRFSEKVWCRQLYVRDKRFVHVTDKLKVREFVANIVGDEYLIPLLWCGTQPKEIPWGLLPAQFVLKANHGCGYNIIVMDKGLLNQSKAIQQLCKWLAENFGQKAGLGIAWAYKKIKPQIMIEKLLVENGRVPSDYKFFCFAGRMEFFKIDYQRFENHATRFFDRNLNQLNLVEVGLRMHEKESQFPRNLSDMINIAEQLSAGFDFVRVDLYNVETVIYFSELTVYPGGISDRFDNEIYDFKFGEKWTLERRINQGP